jgi:hypothetical protein
MPSNPSRRHFPTCARLLTAILPALLFTASLLAQDDPTITFLPLEPKSSPVTTPVHPRIKAAAGSEYHNKLAILGTDDLPIDDLTFIASDKSTQTYSPKHLYLKFPYPDRWLQTSLGGQTMRLWFRKNLMILPFGDDSSPDIIKADIQVLMPDGSPAKDAWVCAADVVRIRSIDHWGHLWVKTDSKGKARLRMPALVNDLIGKPAPPLWIDFIAQGPDGSNLLSSTLRWSPGKPMVIRFDAPKPRVLRFLDKDQKPLTPEQIKTLSFYTTHNNPRRRNPHALDFDLSQPVRLPPGFYRVRTDQRYADLRVDADTPDTVVIDFSAIRYEALPLYPASTRISGRVLDPDGKPVPDCLVWLSSASVDPNAYDDASIPDSFDKYKFRTTADGTFNAWPKSPPDTNEILLTIQPPSGSRLAQDVVKTRPGNNLEVRLARGRPVIISAPFEDSDLSYSSTQTVLYRLDPQTKSKISEARQSGHLTLVQCIPPGLYRLEKGSRISPTLTLAPDQSKLLFTSIIDPPITLKVYDQSSGKPLSGALVLRNIRPHQPPLWNDPEFPKLRNPDTSPTLITKLLGNRDDNDDFTSADYAFTDENGAAAFNGFTFNNNRNRDYGFIVHTRGYVPISFPETKLLTRNTPIKDPPPTINIDIPLTAAFPITIVPSKPQPSSPYRLHFAYQPPPRAATLKTLPQPDLLFPQVLHSGQILVPTQGSLSITGTYRETFPDNRGMDFDNIDWSFPFHYQITPSRPTLDIAPAPIQPAGSDTVTVNMVPSATSNPLYVRVVDSQAHDLPNALIQPTLTHIHTGTLLPTKPARGNIALHIPENHRVTFTVQAAGKTYTNPDWTLQTPDAINLNLPLGMMTLMIDTSTPPKPGLP